jgi:hypothetical protein
MNDDQLRQVLAGLEAQREQLSQAIANLRQAIDRPNAPDGLVPLKRAAADTKFCPETVRLWVAAGLVAGERRGGSWFVDPQSLAERIRCRSLPAL